MVQPEQIHIAFGDTAQDMVIMWASKRDVNFFVELAETAEKIQKIKAEKAVLSESSNQAARYLHRVYLAKLKPGETYVYRIVGDSGASTSIYSFKVPYTKPGKVHIFMMVADMGLSTKSLQFVTHEAANRLYEAVFHVGDIAYNLHRDEGSFGDRFLKYMEKFAARVPYMTVPGDHERFVDYTHYRYRFSMPNTRWPMPKEQLWYRINIGPVCFISLNTEVFYTLTDQQGAQLDWLRDQLYIANTQREQHPWIIVLGHRPMYCSHSDVDDQFNEDCMKDSGCVIRTKLEDLLFEEGVDLYISGHRHNYERSWPLYRGKDFQRGYRDPRAPVHIINGAMGYEYLTETIPKPQSWSAFSLSDPRKELYSKLEVLNSTHLKWDAFAASDNEHIDSMLIIQHRHGSFGKAGDEAYKTLMQLQKLPPAPFHWQPPAQNLSKETVFHAIYRLPPSTRKLYLTTMCLTLIFVLIGVLCMPRVRRVVCRARK
ncbi:hypothetical protein ACOMHN_016382 [Nucella lapillus]